jgi:hypothetical protein
MPNCFAMGQAAGMAAAMAAGTDSHSRKVDITALQRGLVQQGAWLGEALTAL